MPEFWTHKVFNLPRWAWAGMIAGGIGVGIYLRYHSGKAGEEVEPEEEGYLNSGQLMPPGAPIEGGGGGGGAVAYKPPESSSPPPPESEKPEAPGGEGPEPEDPELPGSGPPTEPISPPFHENTPIVGPVQEPVHGQPITAPGTPGIGPGHPAQPPIGVGPGYPVKDPEREHKEQLAREQAERTAQEKIAKKQAEISRLQSEIDGLQNHIAQLTAVIQAHPKAQQRGQWENERDQDRTNIENKRGMIQFWNNW